MSALKRLHNIDKGTKLFVTGYIRRKHKSLFKNNKYALFQNIPIAISSLCTLYYYLSDHFDLEIIDSNSAVSSYVKFSKDFKTATTIPNDYCDYNENMIYGKLIIASMDKCVYKWFLKFHKNMPELFGLHAAPWTTEYVASGEHIYYECMPTGNKKLNDRHRDWHDKTYFDWPYSIDDIFCLELDLKKKCISFYINDKDLGPAFKEIDIGPDIQYRFCVSFGDCDESVSIVKVTQTYY